MLEYIYVCRHGFRTPDKHAWSVPDADSGAPSPTGTLRDYPLAALGHVQARDLATFLTTGTAPHPAPEAILSSPFYRCIQTALPLASALAASSKGRIMVDHGVAEWYGPARAGSGLHPRPGGARDTARFFPENSLDEAYASTVFPSRKGETLEGLLRRIGLFISAWVPRMDEMGVRSVVIFAHAATVIALGRMLTGDLRRKVTAGCAVTSLYKRKTPTGGVGEWEGVYDGRADYMPGGVERDWAFSNITTVNGQVPEDEGDHMEHAPEDELPVGLAEGMERYLRKGGVMGDGKAGSRL